MLHTTQDDGAALRPVTRVTEVSIGVLFLLATATFAIGGALLSSYFEDGQAGKEHLVIIGALLQMACGLAVAAIGWLLYRVLKSSTPRTATGYLIARMVECAGIFACSLWVIVTKVQVPEYDLLIYGFTGLGGLLLTSALWTTRLVPRWLAVLGLFGYAVFLAALPFDLVGLGELDATLEAALIPGGLFEIALPLLLILHGFTHRLSAPTLEARHAQTPANG